MTKPKPEVPTLGTQNDRTNFWKPLASHWKSPPQWVKDKIDAEPDFVQFTDDVSEYVCTCVRNDTIGTWCGFVFLPKNHKLYGKLELRSYVESKIQVYGGVTFAVKFDSSAQEGEWLRNVHPIRYENGVSYWQYNENKQGVLIGFDTGHSDDLWPRMCLFDSGFVAYRDLDYVMAQTMLMAQQLKIVENNLKATSHLFYK